MLIDIIRNNTFYQYYIKPEAM